MFTATPGKGGSRALCHPIRRQYRTGLCIFCWAKRNGEDVDSLFRQPWPAGRRLQRPQSTRHGLSKEQEGKLHELQNGFCAICGYKPVRLVLDHDHRTGLARGLLCYPCNMALGQLRDDPYVVRSAARYLEAGGVVGRPEIAAYLIP